MYPQLTTDNRDEAGQVGMTLAAIAYAADLQAIQTLLVDPALATQGRWTVVWYGVDPGNQAYVALDKSTGQYAIAIRGSATSPFSASFWIDWFQQDLDVLAQQRWPFGGAPANVCVSQGTLDGLDSLLGLEDGKGNNLVEFFRSANPQPRWITPVIGHSLGGALASALAPYLDHVFSPEDGELNFWPLTFAAPTAGNAAFADWIEYEFAGSIGRYHNTLDVVPHAWGGLQWIVESFPDGPSLPNDLRFAVDDVRRTLKLIQADYRQPGPGNVLEGAVAPNMDWFGEAGVQHGSAMYLSLLGAPALTDTALKDYQRWSHVA